MHIIKVKRNGKLDILQTLRINTPAARVPKSKRKSLRTIKATAARRERDARLLKVLAQ